MPLLHAVQHRQFHLFTYPKRSHRWTRLSASLLQAVFECDSFAEHGVKTIHLCSTDTVCYFQAHSSKCNVRITENTYFTVSKNLHKLLFFQTSLQLSIFLCVGCIFVCFLENAQHKRRILRSPKQRLRLTELNSLCSYVTCCMNNEQKATKS